MKLLKNLFTNFKKLSIKKKILIAVILIIIAIFIWFKLVASSSQAAKYQTAKVSKGTLVVSLTEPGQVSVANKVSIVTQASGIVNSVYVKSGDSVNQGDKIADVTLDTAGQQKQAQAWSSYLSAQNAFTNANIQLYTLQNQLFVANQKFINDKGIANPTDEQKSDPIYIEENANWLAAEAAYKNQTNVISQAQAGVNNAWLTYQLTSGTIIAPTNGVIGDLVIAKGMQIGSSNTTSGSSTNTSNQAVAAVKTGSQTIISISVAEVDAPNVKVGQKVTVTFDALTDKTFTGKVIGIDTTGSVSSGVTTYPAIVELDSTSDSIMPNMSATANIIVKIVDNALLVPSASVQTVGETSSVRILKNGKLSQITVQTGDTSNAETVITSGLSEGDTVVTSTISTSTTSPAGSSSPFSGGLRMGGFSGGAGGNTNRSSGSSAPRN